MLCPDNFILYSINVEDVRRVAEEEGFRELTDDEIKVVGDKIGGYIEWYEAIRMTIQEAVPNLDTPKCKSRKATP